MASPISKRLQRCQGERRPGPLVATRRSYGPKVFGVERIIRVRRAYSKRELDRAFAIRFRVFVREQKVPQSIEMDRDDERAIHLLALLSDNVVGAARVVIRGRSAKIGRMAVLKSYRKRGVGRKLLQRSVAIAKRRSAKHIYLHAQVPVIGFYEAMGFRCVGPIFDEAGIPHRKMILQHPAAKRFERRLG